MTIGVIEPAKKVLAHRAARCAAAFDDTGRELIYFLQAMSHEPGGLRKAAFEILAANPHRLGSLAMHRAGMGEGVEYVGDVLEIVCEELGEFPLETRESIERQIGMVELMGLCGGRPGDDLQKELRNSAECEEEIAELREKLNPENRRAAARHFIEACRRKAATLARHLKDVCVKPGLDWQVSWFADLPAALNEFQVTHAELSMRAAANTSIAATMYKALDYTYKTRGLVWINGLRRIGKTTPAEAWVKANSGRARYVSLESGQSETGFFREIANAIGCGYVETLTAYEIRSRIGEALGNRDLMLVIDEAHNLFTSTRGAEPKRVEWLRTALVNKGVPVALIFTPQFISRMKAVEKASGFELSQFRFRVTKFFNLPDVVSGGDYETLARHLAPSLGKSSIATLAAYAETSDAYFHAVRTAVNEALFLADEEGEKLAGRHVQCAVRELLQVDQILNIEMGEPQARAGRGKRSCKTLEKPLKDSFWGRESHDPASIVTDRLRSIPRPSQLTSDRPRAAQLAPG
jgi:hypothetical protein